MVGMRAQPGNKFRAQIVTKIEVQIQLTVSQSLAKIVAQVRPEAQS